MNDCCEYTHVVFPSILRYNVYCGSKPPPPIAEMLFHKRTFLALMLLAPLTIFASPFDFLSRKIPSDWKYQNSNNTSGSNDLSSLPYPPGFNPKSCPRRPGPNLWDGTAESTHIDPTNFTSSLPNNPTTLSSTVNNPQCYMIAQITYKDLRGNGRFFTPPIKLHYQRRYVFSYVNDGDWTRQTLLGRHEDTLPAHWYPLSQSLSDLRKQGSEVIRLGGKSLIAIVEYEPHYISDRLSGEFALFELPVPS